MIFDVKADGVPPPRKAERKCVYFELNIQYYFNKRKLILLDVMHLLRNNVIITAKTAVRKKLVIYLNHYSLEQYDKNVVGI